MLGGSRLMGSIVPLIPKATGSQCRLLPQIHQQPPTSLRAPRPQDPQPAPPTPARLTSHKPSWPGQADMGLGDFPRALLQYLHHALTPKVTALARSVRAPRRIHSPNTWSRASQ
jgi:hypothetical protein